MTVHSPGEGHLENVIFRLMDYQSGEKKDHIDTMIMISLVNLLGIISVINKQSFTEVPRQRSMGDDPMVKALLGTLGQMNNQQSPLGGGSLGINPSMLLNLLGSGGQKPENALLMALLSSLLSPRPASRPASPPASPPAQVINSEKGQKPFSRTGENGVPAGVGTEKNIKKNTDVLSWDRRLG